MSAHGEDGFAFGLLALLDGVLTVTALVAFIHRPVNARSHAAEADGDFLDRQRVVPATSAVQVSFKREFRHQRNLSRSGRCDRRSPPHAGARAQCRRVAGLRRPRRA